MEGDTINFYNSYGILLNDKMTNILIEKIIKKYNINTELEYKTPSSKYYKIINRNNETDDDYIYLKNYHHLVTPNYGINPIWILWLTVIDGTKYTLYINLYNRQIIIGYSRFSYSLYEKDTIIEGEILDNFFVANDIIVYNNKIIDKNLYHRISILKNIRENKYINDIFIENLEFTCRIYYEYSHIQWIIEKYTNNYKNKEIEKKNTQIIINNNVYETTNHISKYFNDIKFFNGILFIPLEKSYKCFIMKVYKNDLETISNKYYDINKIKIDTSDQEQECEFYIDINSLCPDNYMIYVIYNNILYQNDVAYIGDIEHSHFIIECIEKNKDKIIHHSGIELLLFKCIFEKKFRRWKPIKLV